MKALKKAFALVLVLAIVMSLSITAFAADTGKIKLVNTVADTNVSIIDQKFDAYKLFDLTVAEKNGAKSYNYTLNADFEAFLAAYNLKHFGETDAGKKKYLTEDALITAVSGYTDKGAEIAAFAKEALEWATGSAKGAYPNAAARVNPTQSAAGKKINETTEAALLDALPLGYYLVSAKALDGQQTLVASCATATTDMDAVVEIPLKLEAPKAAKAIVEGTSDVKGTAAGVGDTVNFKVTSKVPNMFAFDTYQFAIVDTMTEGLTLNTAADKFAVTIGGKKVNVVTTTAGATQPYAVLSATTGGFTLSFGDSDLKTVIAEINKTADPDITTGAEIKVTYSAVVNGDAVSHYEEVNDVCVRYSNDPSDPSKTTDDKKVPHEKTYNYDFSMDILKYAYNSVAPTDQTNVLSGAQFALYKEVTSEAGTKKQYYSADETTGLTVTWVEEAAEGVVPEDATIRTSQINGKLDKAFLGLDAGIYYLVETAAPDGYAKLNQPVKVVITPDYNADGTLKSCKFAVTNPESKAQNKTSEVNLTKTELDALHTGEADSQITLVANIANNSGKVLPTTGGMGTTIFYTVGAILMVSALVLLITKKKMSVN